FRQRSERRLPLDLFAPLRHQTNAAARPPSLRSSRFCRGSCCPVRIQFLPDLFHPGPRIPQHATPVLVSGSSADSPFAGKHLSSSTRARPPPYPAEVSAESTQR